jgi:soluble lytic murein transglycosylase-like protein
MEIIVVGIFILIAVAAYGAASSCCCGGSGSSSMNAAQIKQYAQNAGFTEPDLDTAVAIALAESSGNPNAVGDLTKGVSVGLWQINLKAHPQYTQAQLTDPQTNANAAYAVYSAASGFSPWTTFNSGAYEAYLPGGVAGGAGGCF